MSGPVFDVTCCENVDVKCRVLVYNLLSLSPLWYMCGLTVRIVFRVSLILQGSVCSISFCSVPSSANETPISYQLQQPLGNVYKQMPILRDKVHTGHYPAIND